jgi:hypothetical protein
MGHFLAQVVGLGGHGCMRELGDGETVIGCDRPGCPDCITREYVRRLKRTGTAVEFAEVTHWPARDPEFAADHILYSEEETLALVPERVVIAAQAGLNAALSHIGGNGSEAERLVRAALEQLAAHDGGDPARLRGLLARAAAYFCDWPQLHGYSRANQVRDDLITGKRSGSF